MYENGVGRTRWPQRSQVSFLKFTSTVSRYIVGLKCYFYFSYNEFDEVSIKAAVEIGPKSIEYTKAVEWLTKELQYFCKLDEHVNAITCPDDSVTFLIELSTFLKELGDFSMSIELTWLWTTLWGVYFVIFHKNTTLKTGYILLSLGSFGKVQPKSLISLWCLNRGKSIKSSYIVFLLNVNNCQRILNNYI